MSIKANIPSYLQHFSNEMEVVKVNGTTVGECLGHLVEQFPSFEKIIFTIDGKLSSFLAVYVNGEDSYPEELAKPVKDGDKLSMVMVLGCC